MDGFGDGKLFRFPSSNHHPFLQAQYNCSYGVFMDVDCFLPLHTVLPPNHTDLFWKENREKIVSSQIVSNITHLFLCVFSKIDQGHLKRWTLQLDLGNTTGGLETVVSVHNST